MLEFVQTVISGVTDKITLTDIAAVVAGIIGSGIIAMFAWKFARKGYAFVKNALSGKDADFEKEGERQKYFAKYGKLPDW